MQNHQLIVRTITVMDARGDQRPAFLAHLALAAGTALANGGCHGRHRSRGIEAAPSCISRTKRGGSRHTEVLVGWKTMWDPSKITMPVLMIQAEWDADCPPYMDSALFPQLTNAPEKRYVMIGEGTHTVIMEENRMQLFREVQWFLDEGANIN